MSTKTTTVAARHESNGSASAKRPPASFAPLRHKLSLHAPATPKPQHATLELCLKYGVDEDNLALRRQFIGLGDEDRSILLEMIPWAQKTAAQIAEEFYDWQFSFAPTCEFFERFAKTAGIPLAALRERLEAAQANYFVEIFEGAENNWDTAYFEQRLKVGKAHERIGLPFKWYVGSYAHLERLTGLYLQQFMKDKAKVLKAERAISKVFNLDMQAISDAFLLSTVESMGLNIEVIQADGDKTEHLPQLKSATAAALEQLNLLGQGDFRTTEFDSLVKTVSVDDWALGSSVNHLLDTLRVFIAKINQMSAEHNSGDIDAIIPTELFTGEFKTLAQGVNDMVGGHIAVKKKAMACVAEFGKGNFDAPLDRFPGKKAFINDTIELVRENLKALVDDATMLTKAAAAQQFETRADATRHQGGYREVVDGINGTLDVVVDKLNWYQAIIDAVQFPIHVIDRDMKWVFLNKAFEKLMVENGIIRSRADAPGMPCSSARANICKTDGCGLVQLSKGNSETYFDWNGQKCRQESSKLTNRKGEHVGFVEVVQDLTSIVAVKDYTDVEVARLASNLAQIAKGELDVDLKLAEAGKFTNEVKTQFGQINDNLGAVVGTIQLLKDELVHLVDASHEGQLSKRELTH